MAATHILSSPVWRNVSLLALAQALANTLQTMGIAATPLVAYTVLGPDKSMATLPSLMRVARSLRPCRLIAPSSPCDSQI